jgi:pyridoxamine 5'-phosphate oxidase
MPLSPDDVDPDPVVQFSHWYAEAAAAGVRQPDAMTLATATPAGRVAARTVLLRGHDARGFVFFTNYESAKASDLSANPRAALVFHWREMERQVRIEGPVSVVDGDEADAYWASRARGHRIGAWASPQSEVIDADELEARVRDVEERFARVEPPRPGFWGGYRVGVDELELWQGRPDRLHERLRYRRRGDVFVREVLAP